MAFVTITHGNWIPPIGGMSGTPAMQPAQQTQTLLLSALPGPPCPAARVRAEGVEAEVGDDGITASVIEQGITATIGAC